MLETPHAVRFETVSVCSVMGAPEAGEGRVKQRTSAAGGQRVAEQTCKRSHSDEQAFYQSQSLD